MTEQSSADRASKRSHVWVPMLPRNPMEEILSSSCELPWATRVYRVSLAEEPYPATQESFAKLRKFMYA